MITERQEELASLHALGLLEGAEKSAFESELAASRELQALHAELVSATAAMALTSPAREPPAALKDQVLARCAAASGPSARPNRPLPFSPGRVLPWAAAAAFALAAAWYGRKAAVLRDQNEALRTDRELAEVAYRMARSQLAERTLVAEKMINDLGQKLRHSEDLARLKISALASLAGNTKEAQVIAVWDPDQQAGLLSLDKLPAIADTQDYQLWIVDPNHKDPVSAGVFHTAADGRMALPFWPDHPVTKATAFAISVERKGGVAKAEGPIVMLGQ
ncbi:MAG TPA: anti-sigma factor [Lacunisphaera sp.]|jgi:anti-sigma-K factor RskA|nr:anti-sigma factor [Lacunisphaera sp.]